MRGYALALFALIALAGCDREPSFEEKYQAEAEQIERSASNMQAELDRQLNASIAARRLAPEQENATPQNAAAIAP